MSASKPALVPGDCSARDPLCTECGEESLIRYSGWRDNVADKVLIRDDESLCPSCAKKRREAAMIIKLPWLIRLHWSHDGWWDSMPSTRQVHLVSFVRLTSCDGIIANRFIIGPVSIEIGARNQQPNSELTNAAQAQPRPQPTPDGKGLSS